MKVGDEVRITWLDSVRQGPDWEDTIDVIPRVEPTLVRSYGVIIEAKKEYVVVAPHYGEGPGEFYAMPRGHSNSNLQYKESQGV